MVQEAVAAQAAHTSVPAVALVFLAAVLPRPWLKTQPPVLLRQPSRPCLVVRVEQVSAPQPVPPRLWPEAPVRQASAEPAWPVWLLDLAQASLRQPLLQALPPAQVCQVQV